MFQLRNYEYVINNIEGHVVRVYRFFVQKPSIERDQKLENVEEIFHLKIPPLLEISSSILSSPSTLLE